MTIKQYQRDGDQITIRGKPVVWTLFSEDELNESDLCVTAETAYRGTIPRLEEEDPGCLTTAIATGLRDGGYRAFMIGPSGEELEVFEPETSRAIFQQAEQVDQPPTP